MRSGFCSTSRAMYVWISLGVMATMLSLASGPRSSLGVSSATKGVVADITDWPSICTRKRERSDVSPSPPLLSRRKIAPRSSDSLKMVGSKRSTSSGYG